MAALSRYWRCIWDFFLAWSHRHLRMDTTDFLCSLAGCTPSDEHAHDRGTTAFPSFMHISEMLEYLCSLLWTCVTFSGEASMNCREHYVLLLFYKTRRLMIPCEQAWQLLNLLGCILANFPALGAFHYSTRCLVISACSSEALGNHRSHLLPWKFRALSTQPNRAVPPYARYDSYAPPVQSATFRAKQTNGDIINH